MYRVTDLKKINLVLNLFRVPKVTFITCQIPIRVSELSEVSNIFIFINFFVIYIILSIKSTKLKDIIFLLSLSYSYKLYHMLATSIMELELIAEISNFLKQSTIYLYKFLDRESEF